MTRKPEETLYDYIARLDRQGVRSTNAGPLVRSAMASPDELASALRAAFTQRDSALLSFIELVAESEDDDNRAIAKSLLHARGTHTTSPTGEGGT